MRRIHFLLIVLVVLPLFLLVVVKRSEPRSELMFISGNSISITGKEQTNQLCRRMDHYFNTIGFKRIKPEYYQGRFADSPKFVLRAYPRHVYENTYFNLVIEQFWPIDERDSLKVHDDIKKFEKKLSVELSEITAEDASWHHSYEEGRFELLTSGGK